MRGDDTIKVITFFNNKGGVGKTTLAVNIASYIGKSKKVLFIDADPQSNSTQIMLTEELLQAVYKPKSKYTTLLKYLDPLLKDEPGIYTKCKPMTTESNRFNVDIIPGHPRISLVEDILSEAWNKCQGGHLGAFRKTNWLKDIINLYKDDYDYVFLDLGPSLGALNRSILLNSDYFIAPMGCDIFSLMGIENIASWINDWRDTYDMAIPNLIKKFPEEYQDYQITIDISNKFRLTGFSVQQYITKVISGKRRGIKAYEVIINQISQYVEANLSSQFAKDCTITDLDLGSIPHLYSLVPLAQTSRSPIHALERTDGIVGNQFKMVDEFSKLIEKICVQIMNNIGDMDE